MYKYNGNWYSSFISMAEHQDGGISQNFQVLSVRSASSGDGRHVSMYLEFMDPEVNNTYVTKFFELTAGADGQAPNIKIDIGQAWGENGTSFYENKKFMCGDQVKLLQTHHTSYIVNAAKSKKILAAARRYSAKADEGKYIYHRPGGKKARMLAFGKRGHGVNCADFVMKVLREADIVDIKTKWISTPLRAAKP